jgi:hypothetical protein
MDATSKYIADDCSSVSVLCKTDFDNEKVFFSWKQQDELESDHASDKYITQKLSVPGTSNSGLVEHNVLDETYKLEFPICKPNELMSSAVTSNFKHHLNIMPPKEERSVSSNNDDVVGCILSLENSTTKDNTEPFKHVKYDVDIPKTLTIPENCGKNKYIFHQTAVETVNENDCSIDQIHDESSQKPSISYEHVINQYISTTQKKITDSATDINIVNVCEDGAAASEANVYLSTSIDSDINNECSVTLQKEITPCDPVECNSTLGYQLVSDNNIADFSLVLKDTHIPPNESRHEQICCTNETEIVNPINNDNLLNSKAFRVNDDTQNGNIISDINYLSTDEIIKHLHELDTSLIHEKDTKLTDTNNADLTKINPPEVEILYRSDESITNNLNFDTNFNLNRNDDHNFIISTLADEPTIVEAFTVKKLEDLKPDVSTLSNSCNTNDDVTSFDIKKHNVDNTNNFTVGYEKLSTPLVFIYDHFSNSTNSNEVLQPHTVKSEPCATNSDNFVNARLQDSSLFSRPDETSHCKSEPDISSKSLQEKKTSFKSKFRSFWKRSGNEGNVGTENFFIKRIHVDTPDPDQDNK